MTPFEKLLIEEAKSIREQLSECETLARMDFTIAVEGRVSGGDLEVTFGLGEYGREVVGNSVDAVVAEYLRRHGWQRHNNPLCIAQVPLNEIDEDAVIEQEEFASPYNRADY